MSEQWKKEGEQIWKFQYVGYKKDEALLANECFCFFVHFFDFLEFFLRGVLQDATFICLH